MTETRPNGPLLDRILEVYNTHREIPVAVYERLVAFVVVMPRMPMPHVAADTEGEEIGIAVEWDHDGRHLYLGVYPADIEWYYLSDLSGDEVEGLASTNPRGLAAAVGALAGGVPATIDVPGGKVGAVEVAAWLNNVTGRLADTLHEDTPEAFQAKMDELRTKVKAEARLAAYLDPLPIVNNLGT